MDKLDIHEASKEEIEEAHKILSKFTFPYSGCRTLGFNKKELELALVGKENNEIIGFCYADKEAEDSRTRKTAYIGCFVKPDAQSKGIGTKLIKELVDELKKKGFVRAECDIAEENAAACKMIENLGFKREGTLRKRFLTDDGRLIDDYWYGKVL